MDNHLYSRYFANISSKLKFSNSIFSTPLIKLYITILLKKEEQRMIRVGKPAPLFTAPAFYNGQFINVSLDDYKGKWVLLCFYPGDFTFV